MKRILLIVIVCFWGFFSQTKAALIPFIENGRIGYIDSTGAEVIKAKFDTPITYERIMLNGRELIDYTLPIWSEFSEGMATVKIKKRFWFITLYHYFANISETGEIKFNTGLNIVHNFHDGIAVTQAALIESYNKYDEKYGYLDKAGEIIIDPMYKYASRFKQNRAFVLDSNKYYYINKKAERISKNFFEDANLFYENLAAVKIGNKYGFIDTNGQIVIQPRFELTWKFSEGMARIYDNNYYGFIDKSGKTTIAPLYTQAKDFSEGLAMVSKDGLCGYIKPNGEYALAPKFTNASSFSEGLAVVEINGKFGFIDKTGNVVIEAKFDYATNFINGVAKVWNKKVIYMIDKSYNQTHKILKEMDLTDAVPTEPFKY